MSEEEELNDKYNETMYSFGNKNSSSHELKRLELRGLEEEEMFFRMVREQREKVK